MQSSIAIFNKDLPGKSGVQCTWYGNCCFTGTIKERPACYLDPYALWRRDIMKKISIVDDESLIRFSLSSLFREPRTEVYSVETGVAALDAVRSHRLDLCFLDIHLPDLNGLEIMKTLRAISPWTRIIVMTGSLITDAMMGSIRDNAHCLITKPFDLDEVGAVAMRLLAPGRMPGGDEALVPKDSCVLWFADEVRKHSRRPGDRDLDCFVIAPPGTKDPLPVSAKLIDISESGMCILTPVELQRGHLVRSNDKEMKGGGIVRWSLRDGPAGHYRAGIQFVAPLHIDYLMGTSGACLPDDRLPA
jgi:CheY-like chemotaxis protein